jgi:CMP-N-acetylneuraminic acid synthetase
MKPLCVIPARRGSKRLPLKNILPLNGKPMLVYSVECASESEVFDQVFVSTEDPEIASIAESAGAKAHLRPAELAGDLVSAADVCIEVYERRISIGERYDSVVCLQPTSPLRSADDVRLSWRSFCESGADFLVSVTAIDPHYFHWAMHSEGEWWRMFFGEKYLMERPLLPPVYRPNGSIKIARAQPLLDLRIFFGPRLTVYETPEARSVHVAEEFDFKLAGFLLQERSAAVTLGGAAFSQRADRK